MDLKMTSSSSSSSCSSSSSSSSCADEQRRRRRLDEQDNLDSSLCDVNNNNVCALNSTGTLPTIHIATWATVAPTLQAYADAYNQAHPQAPLLSLTILDSIRDLQTSTTSDLLQQQQDSPNLSFLYDGYVMPPLMVGPLVEQQGLLALDEFQEESFYSDILPYYRNLVAEFDGRIRSLPLFAGSQLVLLYRKDYLDLYDLDVPETWTDMELVASVIRNRTPLMGMCLGRLTEEGCRKRRQVTGEPCQSLSMSYLGMQLASMTQAQGNSSGWWLEERERLETEHSYGGRLEPLWNNTLEQVLSMMESQTSTQSESVEALQQDGQWNLEMFRKGMCAMTIVANHPADVLTRSSAVGFAPLPGSLQVLDRTTTTSAGTLQNCTTSSCPFGSDKDASSTGERYRYNRVPFGATDAVVGSVSAAAPPEHQQVVKDFLKFILTTTNVVDAPVFREQPFRYSQLEPLKSSNPAYADLIESLTTDESNAAIPFRIPEALTMWTELDTGVHDYLLADNYTQDNRQQFRIRMEETWERIMDQHDNHQGVDAVPLSIFYQQSLGTFTPAAASDLYIGQSFRVVGWTLGGIGMCLSITMACWVYYYRNKRVIRASQPMFLWMVCAGTLLMSSSIFPFGIEDDIVSDQGADMACMSGIWLYSLGFVTAFSALFSKIWRINRVSLLASISCRWLVLLYFMFQRSALSSGWLSVRF
jgi:ABC-type glycerol-3-phosphate transport system substrate-binding protein